MPAVPHIRYLSLSNPRALLKPSRLSRLHGGAAVRVLDFAEGQIHLCNPAPITVPAGPTVAVSQADVVFPKKKAFR